ncbi:Gcd10p family-domain-containing protein [Rhypophila decipiens]|uniref:tRNA (adenine(58)-N(1))-methyltransferase non-catalytic subunit TRM6 n=1 Tax=Rhypophila decipiens TaxID=261697 RepID=A0AAN6YBG8_9PEZI|nr:Gcd10p family-domain-containing protein [Rhypophila decipiens]
MDSVIKPGAWVVLQLPSGINRVIQVSPNTTISLGKYGSFPANLILERPYNLTFEILDRKEGEKFSRLRVVPTAELYAEIFADEASPECAAPTPNAGVATPAEPASAESTGQATAGKDVTETELKLLDENARQTLTQDEIEELKKNVTNAGKSVIDKLMSSHTAIDQKTSFSLAKYKLLKTKKYIRRFKVLPVDVPNFLEWQLSERDPSKILDIRAEMLGLVGCWANVHYGGDAVYLEDPGARCDAGGEAYAPLKPELFKGRWLVVDDTCGALTAAMAERMGLLYPEEEEDEDEEGEEDRDDQEKEETDQSAQQNTEPPAKTSKPPRGPRPSDFAIPYSQTNTITVVHAASQPNLSFLKYWGFDITAPNHPPHPLLNHLLNLTWLQLVQPERDLAYSLPPLTTSAETLMSWKPSRRGNFHRKRRRSARIRHIVDATRAGNFSGLVCASTMDPVSILKYTLPLLAGGATVAIYSPSIEPLAELADCFSVPRRTAWTSGSVPETAGKTAEELERWPGTPDFPLNPTLLLGTSLQTSRARRSQVLPGRTHPLMTERGGAEGYVFTAFRAKPAEGHVEAMGKWKKKKTEGSNSSVAAAAAAQDAAPVGADKDIPVEDATDPLPADEEMTDAPAPLAE